MELVNKKVLVVGLGKSGMACARFLSGRGARVMVSDSAERETLADEARLLSQMQIQAVFGRHDPADFHDSELIVLSPGVPHTIEPVRQAASKGIPVIGEIELAAAFIREPIIAVTGTNGKTTTTALLGKMLKESGMKTFVGGNIGTPLITYAEEPTADWVVAEVSSFQLDTIRNFHANVAVLLNITADHLDRYPDMAAYAGAKARIFANQNASDAAVLNAADPRIRAMASGLKAKRLFFNTPEPSDEGAWIESCAVRVHRRASGGDASGHLTNIDFDLSGYRLLGPHNRENAAAACLAALTAGATPGGIQKALNRFEGLPHRMWHVATFKGVQYYDDSKATNADSTIRAVESFRQPVVLILGGRDKGADWQYLAERLQARLRKVIAMGESRNRILQHLAPVIPSEAVSGMAEAVLRARQAATDGDAVLLAPGCASFDSYANYAERGNDFIGEVNRMVKGDGGK